MPSEGFGIRRSDFLRISELGLRILPCQTLAWTSEPGRQQMLNNPPIDGLIRPMKASSLLPLGFLAAGLCLGLSPFAPAARADRMNLISLVTDDQAAWSLGCYGNKESITPNMDRLAKEGARFLNAFTATPVCSPSRATYLTGRWGTQLGITDYLAPMESDAGLGLPVKSVIWPKVLKDHGYTTGLIGKWHLGTKEHFYPAKFGIDHFYGFLGGGTTPMNPTLDIGGTSVKLNGSLPDLLVDNALQFVETNQARPFALLIHFRAPHLPYGPVPPEDSAPFKDLDPTVPRPKGWDIDQLKKWTRDYYASIHSVDRNLGRLFARLTELGLMEKTIITFTSDHGYNIGHHGIHTKGNGIWVAGGVSGPKRPNMFETSMRVPLLVRWPGVVPPGMKISEPVSNLDTFPSVLGMLGVPRPGNWKLEGADFSPLLRGVKLAWRDTLFAQYDLHNNGLAYMRMVRTDQWKLVRHFHENMMDELYDLAKDPDETKNLLRGGRVPESHREVYNDLLQRLTQWQRSIDDPVLRQVRLGR